MLTDEFIFESQQRTPVRNGENPPETGWIVLGIEHAVYYTYRDDLV
jgi:hypothetical protein